MGVGLTVHDPKRPARICPNGNTIFWPVCSTQNTWIPKAAGTKYTRREQMVTKPGRSGPTRMVEVDWEQIEALGMTILSCPVQQLEPEQDRCCRRDGQAVRPEMDQ